MLPAGWFSKFRTFLCLVLWFAVATVTSVSGAEVEWRHLSSAAGDLPAPPGGSKQQTGVVIGDFDGDGINGFIVSFRQKPPALVWYRRSGTGWKQYVIEPDYLTVEAGGAVYDIDGDGDLDVVFGGDWQSSEVWWWENPSPSFDPPQRWRRHLIKSGGQKQHHDQAFGDFLGIGKAQLAFWNQQAKTIFLARIPGEPRTAESWPLSRVVSGAAAASTPYTEGMSAADVNGDGRVDLLAYDSWFQARSDGSFERVQVARVGGLIFAGKFKQSRYLQIVTSPGDGGGPVQIHECRGDPADPGAWVGRNLLDREVVHGHSLQLGDIDGDGHLDIFVAEMAKWHEQQAEPDNPNATAWILYGDGKGDFRKTILVKGNGWHEARLADLDGDGDLDILNKPYTWETPRIDIWLNEGL
jgi:hypothetical protein